MSKQVRNIIIMVIVLLFLIGGLVAVMFLLKDSDDGSSDSDSSTEDESFVVLDKKAKDSDVPVIKEIVYKDKGTRPLEKDEDEENSSSKSSDSSESSDKENSKPVSETEFSVKLNSDDYLSVVGYDDIPVESYITTSLGSTLSEISSSRKFEDIDAAAYGLENPHNIVKVTYHDDSVVTFNVGNKTPTGTGYYISLNDEKTAYLVSTTVGDALMKKDTDFIGTSLITPPETSDETEQVVLRNLELSGTLRKNKPFEIRIVNQNDPSQFTSFSHVITSPGMLGTNDTLMNTVSTSASTLTAVSAYMAKPSTEAIKAVGLDNPYSICMQTLAVQTPAKNEGDPPTMSKDKSYTIKLGNKNEDGYYYAMIDGVDVIYLVSESSVPWAEKTYNDFATTLLFLFNIQNVKTVKVKDINKETVFNLEHFEEEDDSDENLKVTVDGKTLDTSSFRTVYRSMMSISRYGDIENSAIGDKIFEFEIVDLDGKVVFKAKFSNYNASLLVCEISGIDPYTVQASKFNTMTTYLRKYLAGEIIED